MSTLNILFTTHPFISLGLCALFAGTIDTIAGGGGLITVPALLLTGMPPAAVLGTNKLQACFGVGTATTRFFISKDLHFKDLWLGFIFCVIGAVMGTLCIESLHPTLLKQILPYLLILCLLYTLLKPKLLQLQRHFIIPHPSFLIIFGLLLGFYDGFLGPGTGSFWVVAFCLFQGWDMQRATIHTKFYNFISNVASLMIFAIAGHVVIIYGLVMAAAQIVGGLIGSQLILMKGERLIRPLFLTMTLVLLISLIL